MTIQELDQDILAALENARDFEKLLSRLNACRGSRKWTSRKTLRGAWKGHRGSYMVWWVNRLARSRVSLGQLGDVQHAKIVALVDALCEACSASFPRSRYMNADWEKRLARMVRAIFTVQGEPRV